MGIDALAHLNRIAVLTVVGLAMAGTAWTRVPNPVSAEARVGSTAEPGGMPQNAFVQLPNQRGLTLAEAIVIAQRRHPGRVVRSQTIQQGNGAVHEVRIIGNDGGVHTVRVDARTGAVQ